MKKQIGALLDAKAQQCIAPQYVLSVNLVNDTTKQALFK